MQIPLLWIVFGLCLVLVGVKVQEFLGYGQILTSSSPDQPYRTAFHFQPPQNWMNDPNGPMYHNGIYHLFYQYNPYGPTWGNMTWGHSISYDLVNWIHIDHALFEDQPYDINGVFSGSITFLEPDKPVILYTGVDKEFSQTQNVAWPKNLSDPFLREWIKAPQNPVMSPIENVLPDYFRDPTTAWKGHDGKWRVLVGNLLNGRGQVLVYTSEDFVKWTRSINPLHSSSKTPVMWECPDFFPVSSGSHGVDLSSEDNVLKHVLKASMFTVNIDCYVLGNYVVEKDRFLPDTDFEGDVSDLRFDYGNFYASKTFFDSSKKRRVLWAWINESLPESDAYKLGWFGIQSFPRSVLLSENQKQLILWPVEEIKDLRDNKVSFHDKKLKGGSLLKVPGITASQADVEVLFSFPSLELAEVMEPSWDDPARLCSEKSASVRGKIGPFGLLVLASKGLKEQTAVYFHVFRSSHDNDRYVVLMCSDQSRSSLMDGIDKATFGAFVDIDPINEKISLRTLIDHSVVESFGGEGRSCITARVYPTLAVFDEAELYAFNNGTLDVTISRLDAWSMKKAQMVSENKRRRSDYQAT